jgi:diguanylate cyclase (GGDEF)-like protein
MRLSLQCFVLASCLLAIGVPASASCLGSGDAEIEALAKDIGRQPHRALQAIEQALRQGSSLSTEQRAWLEAARAQAKRMIGQQTTELPLAVKGAAALPAGHAARLHLQIAGLYGAVLSQSNRESIEGLHRQLAARPPRQPATLCLKVRLASVMADHVELNGVAFQLASEAYRDADTDTLAWVRAEAASVLGQVALRTDTRYGRALSQAALRYFESQAMHDMAANELFMDALSWAHQRNTGSLRMAEQQFLRSAIAARQANNPLAVAYAEAGLCEVQGQLGRVEDALRTCSASLRQLKGIRHVTEYSTNIHYASALLASGRPRQAMSVLASLQRDWPGSDVGYNGYLFYEAKGKTHAALGNDREAIADLKSALRLLREHESSTGARSSRLIQARFRVDQLEQSLEQKKRESDEKEQRNRLLIGAGLIVLFLLSILVVTLVKNRRLYRRMAFTDPLTGVANRRYTEARAQESMQHALARGQQMHIALLDLDRFKSCNDRYGHDAGDEALQRFASVVKAVLRPGDLFGRWGGEEFLLVLQGVDREGAADVLGRLRAAAASERLALAPEYPLQFSAGVVALPNTPTTLAALLTLADQALFRAKVEGRNRNCFADT